MAFLKVTSACDKIVGSDCESGESCLSSGDDYSPFFLVMLMTEVSESC